MAIYEENQFVDRLKAIENVQNEIRALLVSVLQLMPPPSAATLAGPQDAAQAAPAETGETVQAPTETVPAAAPAASETVQAPTETGSNTETVGQTSIGSP